MKKLSISLIALAALALGACTSDDVALNNKANDVEINGSGYVSLAINLPTTPVTRAANDVYDDGLASEYAVNDATLLLFAGDDEASATCYASYNLITAWNLYESTTDNITSRAELTQLIDTPAGGNIYAMVVLNANGLLSNITVGSGTTVGSSLSDLQTTALTLTGGVSAMTGNGFFMCNAPLTSSKGGTTTTTAPTGSVTTLAVIDPESIFSSAAEAEAHPATEIYVERGMAKVTVVDGTGADATVGSTTIPVTIDGFVLDLTNNVSFLVRNTTGAEAWWGYKNYTSNDYRMAGSVEVADGLYRTYWATDPNYDTYPYTSATTGSEYEGARDYNGVMTSLAGTTPSLTTLTTTETAADGSTTTVATPAYCLENTFNVAHQNEDETTRVIIGATVNNGQSFFILNNDKSTLYTDDEDMNEEGATTGAEKIAAYILTQMHAEGYMEAAEDVWVGPTDEEMEADPTLSADMYDYITVTLGSLVAGDITFTYTVSSDVNPTWFKNAAGYRQTEDGTVPGVLVANSAEYNAVVDDLNDHIEIDYYAGGVSYYPVKIKHFGDDLTYWTDETAGTTGTANAKSYPEGVGGLSSEANWLGRYGVLRNNWYEITVTGVSQIGSATVPTAYGDPDDPTEQWISIEINILSWAKRAQSVTL